MGKEGRKEGYKVFIIRHHKTFIMITKIYLRRYVPRKCKRKKKGKSAQTYPGEHPLLSFLAHACFHHGFRSAIELISFYHPTKCSPTSADFYCRDNVILTR